MVIVVDAEDQAETLAALTKAGESPWVIGHIKQNDGSQEAVVMR
jgi:phosphoribosylaminoimidazole (AIR) synthetase